jgi:hypothetical protein
MDACKIKTKDYSIYLGDTRNDTDGVAHETFGREDVYTKLNTNVLERYLVALIVPMAVTNL